MAVLDLRELSTVTDYFVICTAESPPQMTAVAEEVERAFAARASPIWHTEGTIPRSADREAPREPHWVLMDCGDVVIHIFDPAARALYRLEEMWGDAPRVSLPPDLAVASGRAARAP